MDELKDNPQYRSHHTQTLKDFKDFIQEADEKQQPLEDRCDRITKLNKKIHKLEKEIHKIGIAVPMSKVRATQEVQELANNRKVTQKPALTAFYNAYNDALDNVQAFTKKMEREDDVNEKLSYAKCMEGSIHELEILANAISDNDAKKVAHNMAKDLVDNVGKTIDDAKRNVEKAATKQNAASVDHNDITIEVDSQSKLTSLQKKNAYHQNGSLEEFKSSINTSSMHNFKPQINTTSFSTERDKFKSEMKTSTKPIVQINTSKNNGFMR